MDKQRFEKCCEEMSKYGIFTKEGDKYAITTDFMLWCSNNVAPNPNGVRDAIIRTSEGKIPEEMLDDCAKITFGAIAMIGLEFERRTNNPGHFM